MSQSKKSYFRMVAALTAFCVAVTQIAVAAPFSASTPEVSLPGSVRLNQAIQLSVPSAIATIDKLQPGSGKTIFHIQTAHGHYQAQQNINLLLKDLEKNYGVKTVLVEGSVNALDPQIINFFPNDHDKTRRVVDLLTRKAILKGSEIYLLESKDAKGLGIENKATYNQNLQDFASVVRMRGESHQFLDQLDQGIERLSAVYLDTNLRSFLKRVERKETGDVPYDIYLHELKIAASKNLNIDLSDASWQMLWPMLLRVFTIEKLEKKIDAATFPKQKEAFLKAIKPYTTNDRRLTTNDNRPQTRGDSSGVAGASPEVVQRVSIYSEVEKLLNLKDLSAHLPDPETSALFEKMVEALPASFDYGRFSSVTSFCGILMLKSQIQPEALTQEIGRMEDKIADHLAEKKSAKELVSILKDYRMLKKLFALELVPNEFDRITTNDQRLTTNDKGIQPSALVARLQKLNGGGLGKNPQGVDLDSSGVGAGSVRRAKAVEFKNVDKLDALYTKAIRFYKGARIRDGKMLSRIEERLKETGADKVAVITGGFHSEPFAQYFAKRGYNYALMTPKITTVDAQGRNDYMNVMMWYANEKRLTTNDQRLTTQDQRLTTNDQRLTAQDQRLTTNDQRLTQNGSSATTDSPSVIELGTGNTGGETLILHALTQFSDPQTLTGVQDYFAANQKTWSTNGVEITTNLAQPLREPLIRADRTEMRAPSSRRAFLKTVIGAAFGSGATAGGVKAAPAKAVPKKEVALSPFKKSILDAITAFADSGNLQLIFSYQVQGQRRDAAVSKPDGKLTLVMLTLGQEAKAKTQKGDANTIAAAIFTFLNLSEDLKFVEENRGAGIKAITFQKPGSAAPQPATEKPTTSQSGENKEFNETTYKAALAKAPSDERRELKDFIDNLSTAIFPKGKLDTGKRSYLAKNLTATSSLKALIDQILEYAQQENTERHSNSNQLTADQAAQALEKAKQLGIIPRSEARTDLLATPISELGIVGLSDALAKIGGRLKVKGTLTESSPIRSLLLDEESGRVWPWANLQEAIRNASTGQGDHSDIARALVNAAGARIDDKSYTDFLNIPNRLVGSGQTGGDQVALVKLYESMNSARSQEEFLSKNSRLTPLEKRLIAQKLILASPRSVTNFKWLHWLAGDGAAYGVNDETFQNLFHLGGIHDFEDLLYWVDTDFGAIERALTGMSYGDQTVNLGKIRTQVTYVYLALTRIVPEKITNYVPTTRLVSGADNSLQALARLTTALKADPTMNLAVLLNHIQSQGLPYLKGLIATHFPDDSVYAEANIVPVFQVLARRNEARGLGDVIGRWVARHSVVIGAALIVGGATRSPLIGAGVLLLGVGIVGLVGLNGKNSASRPEARGWQNLLAVAAAVFTSLFSAVAQQPRSSSALAPVAKALTPAQVSAALKKGIDPIGRYIEGPGVNASTGAPNDHVRIIKGEVAGDVLGYGAPSKDGPLASVLLHLALNNPASQGMKINSEQALRKLLTQLSSLREFQKSAEGTGVKHGLFPWQNYDGGQRGITTYGDDNRHMIPTLDNSLTTPVLASLAGSFANAKPGTLAKQVGDLAREILKTQDWSKYVSPNGRLYAEYNFNSQRFVGEVGGDQSSLWTEWAIASLWAYLTHSISTEDWLKVSAPTAVWNSPAGAIDVPTGYRYSMHELWILQLFGPAIMKSDLAPLFRNYLYLHSVNATRLGLSSFPASEYSTTTYEADSGINTTVHGLPQFGRVSSDGERMATGYASAIAMAISPKASHWLVEYFKQPGVITPYGPVTSYSLQGGASTYTTADSTFAMAHMVAEIARPDVYNGIVAYFAAQWAVSVKEANAIIVDAFNDQAKNIAEKLGRPIKGVSDAAILLPGAELPASIKPAEKLGEKKPDAVAENGIVDLTARLAGGRWGGQKATVTADAGEIKGSFPKMGAGEFGFAGSPITPVAPAAQVKYLTFDVPVNGAGWNGTVQMEIKDGNLETFERISLSTGTGTVIGKSADGKWQTARVELTATGQGTNVNFVAFSTNDFISGGEAVSFTLRNLHFHQKMPTTSPKATRGEFREPQGMSEIYRGLYRDQDVANAFANSLAAVQSHRNEARRAKIARVVISAVVAIGVSVGVFMSFAPALLGVATITGGLFRFGLFAINAVFAYNTTYQLSNSIPGLEDRENVPLPVEPAQLAAEILQDRREHFLKYRHAHREDAKWASFFADLAVVGIIVALFPSILASPFMWAYVILSAPVAVYFYIARPFGDRLAARQTGYYWPQQSPPKRGSDVIPPASDSAMPPRGEMRALHTTAAIVTATAALSTEPLNAGDQIDARLVTGNRVAVTLTTGPAARDLATSTTLSSDWTKMQSYPANQGTVVLVEPTGEEQFFRLQTQPVAGAVPRHNVVTQPTTIDGITLTTPEPNSTKGIVVVTTDNPGRTFSLNQGGKEVGRITVPVEQFLPRKNIEKDQAALNQQIADLQEKIANEKDQEKLVELRKALEAAELALINLTPYLPLDARFPIEVDLGNGNLTVTEVETPTPAPTPVQGRNESRFGFSVNVSTNYTNWFGEGELPTAEFSAIQLNALGEPDFRRHFRNEGVPPQMERVLSEIGNETIAVDNVHVLFEDDIAFAYVLGPGIGNFQFEPKYLPYIQAGLFDLSGLADDHPAKTAQSKFGAFLRSGVLPHPSKQIINFQVRAKKSRDAADGTISLETSRAETGGDIRATAPADHADDADVVAQLRTFGEGIVAQMSRAPSAQARAQLTQQVVDAITNIRSSNATLGERIQGLYATALREHQQMQGLSVDTLEDLEPENDLAGNAKFEQRNGSLQIFLDRLAAMAILTPALTVAPFAEGAALQGGRTEFRNFTVLKIFLIWFTAAVIPFEISNAHAAEAKGVYETVSGGTLKMMSDASGAEPAPALTAVLPGAEENAPIGFSPSFYKALNADVNSAEAQLGTLFFSGEDFSRLVVANPNAVHQMLLAAQQLNAGKAQTRATFVVVTEDVKKLQAAVESALSNRNSGIRAEMRMPAVLAALLLATVNIVTPAEVSGVVAARPAHSVAVMNLGGKSQPVRLQGAVFDCKIEMAKLNPRDLIAVSGLSGALVSALGATTGASDTQAGDLLAEFLNRQLHIHFERNGNSFVFDPIRLMQEMLFAKYFGTMA